ncbi:rhombosortase [Pseudoxanthomonas broegbernensis]|uniref:Rhombosortase n=1 Tax=Pseudoxanthomonas broegbernensis TaxID=83619 RepID=A0A7V8GNS2_9GAMM|nr:rhombosortase [Pseudoxanthomonas broegbernensis]KAF1687303.1 rhombosortase [Pseudoxanthomonas broegbernensis]MBB6065699.1 rhomboid family GlyGly-CTERM serine protease [Pseudoxanthomonas broegbernensis]
MGTGLAVGGGRIAPAAAAGLTLAAALAAWAGLRWTVAFEALVLDREAVLSGQVWRLWSGHLLHLDARHALVNLGALAILLPLAARMRALGPLLWTSPLLMPAIALGTLAASPGLQWYAGLSGLLHGWVAWLLVRRGGALAAACMTLLGVKLAWEAMAPGMVAGLPVATSAHQVGVLAGASWALASRMARGGTRPANTSGGDDRGGSAA